MGAKHYGLHTVFADNKGMPTFWEVFHAGKHKKDTALQRDNKYLKLTERAIFAAKQYRTLRSVDMLIFLKTYILLVSTKIN